MDLPGQSTTCSPCQPVLSRPFLFSRGPDPPALTASVTPDLAFLKQTFKSGRGTAPSSLPLLILLLLKISFYLHFGGCPPFGKVVGKC